MSHEVDPRWGAADDVAFAQRAEEYWALDYRQDFSLPRQRLKDILDGRDVLDVVPSPEFASLLDEKNFDWLSVRQQLKNLTAIHIGRETGRTMGECLSTAEKFITIKGRLMQEVKTGFLRPDPDSGKLEMQISIDGVRIPVTAERPDRSGLHRFGDR